MKTVFISRKLATDSILLQLLSSAGLKVYDRSLIQFSLLEFDPLPPCDWIFFYSSNGVRFLLKGLEKNKQPLLEKIRLAAMGKGTAATVEAMIRKPDFIGSGRPDETARAFLRFAEGQMVLFVRAQHSAKSVQNLLSPYINITDLPVYKNEPITATDIPKTDYVVLTSSMNVDAFFQNLQPSADQVFIAIGRPTAIRCAHWISHEVYLPEQPSEEALARLILKLERKNDENE